MKRELDTKSFSTRLETSLAQFSHFACPRFKNESHEFTIHHFAESVSYQVEGLVRKNKVELFFVEIVTVFRNEVSKKLAHQIAVNLFLLLPFTSPLSQDFVPPEVVELLQSSKNVFIQELFQDTDNTKREVRFCSLCIYLAPYPITRNLPFHNQSGGKLKPC